MKKRNIKIIKCLICNIDFSSVGLDSHLKHTHHISTKEYKLKYIVNNIDTSNYNFTCLICNEKFKTERLLSHHLRIKHEIEDKLLYINKYIFNDIKQLCKCGCNKEIKLIGQHPYRRDYISGHNENGMTSKMHNDTSKDKMRIKALNRVTVKKDNTDIEIKFKDILEKNNIKYIHQYKIDKIGIIDFYLPDYNIYVEVDGSYWHPNEIKNLNFQQLSNTINSIRKDEYFKTNNLNLIRVRDNELNSINSIDDILLLVNKFKYININYYDKIVTKEYIQNYISIKGEKKFNSLIYLFIKLLRVYIKEYPYPVLNEFIFNIIRDKLNKNHSNPNTNVFSNNVSNIGTYELKAIFKNYWKSSYNGNMSPYNVYNSDAHLKKIIVNRLITNSNDFSLSVINRGINVLRYSISFFKPQLAFNIYKYFIKEKTTPTVIDPCSGFGGRMIGFISAYPNGKYIGIEPNVETFNYLKHIKDNYLSNYDIELYNITQEQFIESTPSIECDLTFTSIPYHDRELYHGITNTNYIDVEDWKHKFITNIVKYPNLLLNIPMNLSYLFDNYNYDTYYIESNSSNFNNKINKKKRELLIKFK